MKKRAARHFRNIQIWRILFAFLFFLLFSVSPKMGWTPLKIKGILLDLIGLIILFYEIKRTLNSSVDEEPDSYIEKTQLQNALLKPSRISLLTLMLALFLSPIYLSYPMKAISLKNRSKVKSLAENIVKNINDDQDKAEILYRWFLAENGNMFNVYGKRDLLFRIGPLSIYLSKPFICIRIKGHEFPYWILSSRCGACIEYSLFYRELARFADLTVRSVHNQGEDHNWDEVLIRGKWMIVDPSYPRYNVSPRFYEEGRGLNISYVYAEYPNGVKKDITSRYTKLGNLTLTVLSPDGDEIENAKVLFRSNNYKDNLPTGLNCTTNEYGKCNLRLGGGKYTVKAYKEDDFLYNKTEFVIKENKHNSLNIVLRANLLERINWIISRNYWISILITIIYTSCIWVILTLYLLL